MVTFRVAHTDAELSAKEFANIPSQFVELDRYQIFIRLLENGVASTPFSAKILPPVGNRHVPRHKLIDRSRERFATSLPTIEDKLHHWQKNIMSECSWRRSCTPPFVCGKMIGMQARRPIKPLLSVYPTKDESKRFEKLLRSSDKTDLDFRQIAAELRGYLEDLNENPMPDGQHRHTVLRTELRARLSRLNGLCNSTSVGCNIVNHLIERFYEKLAHEETNEVHSRRSAG